ncbi:MAG: hypothetical protein KGR71_03775 [Proteobacteria bacterium]|nr:hypothetical protein [Pseudomonadota bacterium]
MKAIICPYSQEEIAAPVIENVRRGSEKDRKRVGKLAAQRVCDPGRGLFRSADELPRRPGQTLELVRQLSIGSAVA